MRKLVIFKLRCGFLDASLVPTEREIVKDRAVRSIVAMACGDQFPKRVRHRLHLDDARLKIADVSLSDALDLAAGTAPVAP
jgi:hypothetical protein